MTRQGRILIVLAAAGLAVLAALVAVLLNTETDARRRRAAATYEATAAQHLKNLAAAEQNYLDNFGEYATFDQLIAAGILLNKGFAGEAPAVDGYVFRLRLTPRQGDRPPSYSINADPHAAGGGPTADRHLYLDSEVIGIRYSDGRPATATDRQRE